LENRLIAALIFLGTFSIVAATAKDYGVTWEEPPYFYASELHARWLDDWVKNCAHSQIQTKHTEQNNERLWRST